MKSILFPKAIALWGFIFFFFSSCLTFAHMHKIESLNKKSEFLKFRFFLFEVFIRFLYQTNRVKKRDSENWH